MSKLILPILLIFIAVSLGCTVVSYSDSPYEQIAGSSIIEKDLSRIEYGITDEAHIIEIFGEPFSRSTTNGDIVFLYVSKRRAESIEKKLFSNVRTEKYFFQILSIFIFNGKVMSYSYFEDTLLSDGTISSIDDL